MKKRYSWLLVVLTTIYAACLMTSNVLAVKQANIFGLTLPAAVLVFPIVYVLSDVFSECYGYQVSRRTSYLAFACNLLMSLLFVAGIALTPAKSFTAQDGMQAILGSTPRMLVASFAGFLFGDFMNDRVFRRMKAKHANELKGFKARAILSSVVGESCDSLLFYPIAFTGVLPPSLMLQMGIAQVIVKVAYETIISPLTAIVAKKVGEFENGEN